MKCGHVMTSPDIRKDHVHLWIETALHCLESKEMLCQVINNDLFHFTICILHQMIPVFSTQIFTFFLKTEFVLSDKIDKYGGNV